MFGLLLFPAGFWRAFSLSSFHLHLSEIISFSCLLSPSYCVINSVLFPSCAPSFPFCSIMEKVVMLKNMPKPSTLSVPNHFRCAPSFLDTFLSPSLSNWFSASPTTSTFQMLPTLFLLALVNVWVSAAYSPTFQTVLFPRQQFLPHDAMLARYSLSSCDRPSVCLSQVEVVQRWLNLVSD